MLSTHKKIKIKHTNTFQIFLGKRCRHFLNYGEFYWSITQKSKWNLKKENPKHFQHSIVVVEHGIKTINKYKTEKIRCKSFQNQIQNSKISKSVRKNEPRSTKIWKTFHNKTSLKKINNPLAHVRSFDKNIVTKSENQNAVT